MILAMGLETFNILTDSGADASIFPSSVLGKGHPATSPAGKLVDAQGMEIPIMARQDIEVCLKDFAGRTVRLKETVAISDRVGQPIMCFGHLLQSGWGVDAQQTLFSCCFRCFNPSKTATEINDGMSYNPCNS